MGHEAIGIVEEVGSDVHGIRRGQVLSPIRTAAARSVREGLNTSCVHGGFFGVGRAPRRGYGNVWLFRPWEITSICVDFLVACAVLANRSAAGGAESPRFSRHTRFTCKREEIEKTSTPCGPATGLFGAES
jgi:hypothetical protein